MLQLLGLMIFNPLSDKGKERSLIWGAVVEQFVHKIPTYVVKSLLISGSLQLLSHWASNSDIKGEYKRIDKTITIPPHRKNVEILDVGTFPFLKVQWLTLD